MKMHHSKQGENITKKYGYQPLLVSAACCSGEEEG